MENAVSAIYGEVNVSVEKCVEIKGDYVEKWQSCFISVTLKKLVRPETFGPCYAHLNASTLKMEVRGWSGNFKNRYQTTRRNIPEDTYV